MGYGCITQLSYDFQYHCGDFMTERNRKKRKKNPLTFRKGTTRYGQTSD